MLRLVSFVLLSLLTSRIASAEEVTVDPFSVMAEIDSISESELWPGFDPSKIPAALWDGKKTLLFRLAEPPEGFEPVIGRSETYVFDGRHPQIRGNGSTKLNGTWTASYLVRQDSELTGKSYSIRQMAGILTHEMFHVFQRIHHPDWSPNEAILFNYPFDTVERLRLRRLELQAFMRALRSSRGKEAEGWTATALAYRKQRLSLLGPYGAVYEDELQRFEGLADYIERLAAGDPLDRDDRFADFSPGIIRDLGYLEGRWMAALLDRFNPGWKDSLEEGGFDYLAERLSTISSSESPRKIPNDELELLRAEADRDFEAWKQERAEIREEFESRPGYRVIISAEDAPLQLRMFIATHVEALSPTELLHRRVFIAGNSLGLARVRDADCMTVASDAFSIQRIVIAGLPSKPQTAYSDEGVSIEQDGISLKFSQAEVSESGVTTALRLKAAPVETTGQGLCKPAALTNSTQRRRRAPPPWGAGLDLE